MKSYILKIIRLTGAIGITLSTSANAQESIAERIVNNSFMEKWIDPGHGFIVLPSPKKIKVAGIDYIQKSQKTFYATLIKKITKSKESAKFFEDKPEAVKKWNKLHDDLLNLAGYEENHWKNPKFYREFAKTMLATKNINKDLNEVLTSIDDTQFKKVVQQTTPYIILYKEIFANILQSAWRQQNNLKPVTGLVEAELTWVLIHSKAVYHKDGGDWWIWGGIGDSLTRGLICNPNEVIEVISNEKILNSLSIELLHSLPNIAKSALKEPIGQRSGNYEKGTVIKNSPEIEKRRKIAKEKYLPQINKIIADYLKDKKVNKLIKLKI